MDEGTESVFFVLCLVCFVLFSVVSRLFVPYVAWCVLYRFPVVRSEVYVVCRVLCVFCYVLSVVFPVGLGG